MIGPSGFSHSEECTLSIRLSTDGFSFSVHGPQPGGVFRYMPYATERTRSMAANVKAMFRQNEFLSLPYRQVCIYSAGAECLAVPFELFDEEAAEPFYRQSFPGRQGTVLYDILPKSSVVLLHAMDKTVYQLLKEPYPDARFRHANGPLTEYWAAKSRLGNSRKMYADRRGDRLTVCCFDNGRLLLLNTFPCKHVNDCIYYLLYAWKQLDYDVLRDELHLSGMEADEAMLLRNLRNYLREVHIIHPTAEFNRADFSHIAGMPFDLQTSFIGNS